MIKNKINPKEAPAGFIARRSLNDNNVCNGCYWRFDNMKNREDGDRCTNRADIVCTSTSRNDGRNVIFKKLKSVKDDTKR